MSVTDQYRAGLLAALEADGWPDEGKYGDGPANYCDISAAIRAGFTLPAAYAPGSSLPWPLTGPGRDSAR